MAAADDPSPAVRMGVLLALRRTEDPDVARFLNDADPRLVVEAARAINDVPIDAAMPQLAALARRPGLSDPLGFRVLNANFRLGGKENAEAVAAFAARADVSETLRIEALHELADWAKPSGRDRVMGVWRPLEPRRRTAPPTPSGRRSAAIFTGPDKVRRGGRRDGRQARHQGGRPRCWRRRRGREAAGRSRVEALRALAALKDARLDGR